MVTESERAVTEASVSCLVPSFAWTSISVPAVLLAAVDLFVSLVEKARPDSQMNVKVRSPCF